MLHEDLVTNILEPMGQGKDSTVTKSIQQTFPSAGLPEGPRNCAGSGPTETGGSADSAPGDLVNS